MSHQKQVEGAPPMIDPAVLRRIAEKVEFCLWDTSEGERERTKTLMHFGQEVARLEADRVGDNARVYWTAHIERLKAKHAEQLQSLRAALVQELAKLPKIMAWDTSRPTNSLLIRLDDVLQLLTGDAPHGQEQG